MTTPTTFPEANSTLRGGPASTYGTQHDVLDLPTYRYDGGIISCWRLSWRERLLALWHGRVWLHVVTRTTHPPIAVMVERSVFRNAQAEGVTNE